MRLGHLTDLHVDESPERLQRLELALDSARAWGCEHLVVSGDLTRDGSDAQLQRVFGAIAARYRPEATTVVPGNHDRNGESLARTATRMQWLWPFVGPNHYAPAYVGRAGLPLAIMRFDTRMHRQPFALRARGRVSANDLRQLAHFGALYAREGTPVAVVMHHGPQVSPMQTLDGLTNRQAILDVMRRHATTATVLCGHDHRSLDLWDGRILVAPAVVDAPDPLRVYEVRRGSWRLHPVKAASAGNYLRLEA